MGQNSEYDGFQEVGMETDSGNLDVDRKRHITVRITHGIGSLRVKKAERHFNRQIFR